VPQPRRLLIVLLAAISFCVVVWQSARTQSPLRRLTNTTEERINLNPSLSGDGRTVAFESTEDVAGAGGSESFRAIRANVGIDPASFVQMGAMRAPASGISQDGSRIVFAAKENPLGTNADANSEIFLYDSARLIQITNTSPGDIADRVANGNFQPSISDNGRFIAFSSNRDLVDQNTDGNLEIFVYDTVDLTFTQLTNSSGTVGFSDAKISGNGAQIAYIRDSGPTPSANRDLLIQDRVDPQSIRVVAANVPLLVMTYGRAISDDGARIVWSVQTGTNSTQVFLYDERNNLTRQITTLGARATDVALQPTISGDGSRIAFATRRSFLGNTNGGVNLYSFDIPSGTFARVTSGPSNATAEVISSLNDDGSLIAFNFPRVLSGPVSQESFANNSEIYLTATPARPGFGSLTILNRASFGHEPSTLKAIAPDSIAVALGDALAFTTQQSARQADGRFPTNLGGTIVTVNGQPAQILFVSPTEVHFHVPAATVLGSAEVIVTNSDGFQSRGSVTTLRTAPGVFTKHGDGLGEGMILDADTLEPGPFDPAGGNLRLIIFSTGVRNGATVSVSAGGRALTLESIVSSTNLPGLDEVHVLVPADLRGAATIDLVIRSDARDSNPVTVEFAGDARRDILINEFLADPPDSATDPTVGDANHDGVRSSTQDEFVEFVNTTTRDINVSGYQILTRGSTSTSDTLRFTFASDTIMPACTAIVVFGGGAFDPHNPVFGGAQAFKPASGSLALGNTGGVITLRDQAGAIVNLVAYGGSSGLNGNADQSLTRSPDLSGNFALHQSASGSGGRFFSPGTQLTGAVFDPCTPAIARVEVTPADAAIEIGAQQQFSARAFDADNNEVPGVIFAWHSSETSIATIDQSGLAVCISAGLTEIRAIGRDVQSAPANLLVRQPLPVLTSVTISPVNANIGVGETQQFIAQAKDQFGQNIGGVTISFDSDNTTVATVDFVSPTSSMGSAIATVSGRANGSGRIQASSTAGTTTVTTSPAILTVEPGAGQLLLSEFRTRGPSGAADEFVEIYNPTTSTLTIGGLRIRASNGSGTISDRLTITAGKTLGPGCHYLLANSSSGGFSSSVPANQTYRTGITDNGGIAITGSNGTRIIDAVGMSGASVYKEGETLAPIAGNLDQSYERRPGGAFGNGVDTNNNAVDFALTAPTDPENSSSRCLDTGSADLSITNADSLDPVTVGSNLTYTLTLTNNGAAHALNVTVSDNLPSAVTFVSCGSTGGGVCGGVGNAPVVTFPSLASGSSATITLITTANGPAGTTITNTATTSSAIPDSNIANNSATATTFVQAPLPALSINAVAANEGDSGTTTFSFVVSLSAPAPAAGVTFDIATHDNTATAANGDYVSKSLKSETIPAGQQTYTFDVAVNGDTLVESTETFLVNVTNVSGADVTVGQGQGTIQNDDTAILLISQLYAGGGNSGAQFTNDFVEILNRGTTTINFATTPYSVQYAGAAASFASSKVDLISGTMAPGQYFLVQLSSGGANGAPLPTPDAIGSIAMAATAGKVALVLGTTWLTASGCPLATGIADFVGYGTTANCFEGSGRAPAPSNVTADLRKAGGCTDTNDNATDLLVSVPFPRNTSSPVNNCLTGAPTHLTINDVTVTEGDNATTTATFTVSLSAPAASTDITFDIATQDNTATTANSDYVAKGLPNQLIPAGQQTYTFTVNIKGDTAVENDETFFVNVTNVVGATVADGQGVVTIQNDDVPSLSINDVSENEGSNGTTSFLFTVSLSAAAPTGGVTFDIATQDSTATVADNDYLARALKSQTISAGSSTYTFEVLVSGDLSIEVNETFFVKVTNVSGATISDGEGVGTIQNDDSPRLTINDISQSEGNSGTTTFTFTVTSSLPAPTGGIIFDIATADGTAQDDTPPSEDNDFEAKSLTGQMIPAGNMTYTFDVTVNGEMLVEPDETFFVNLTNVSSATVLDGQGQATIENDDTPLVVISQIYGGGGNSNATYTNDFIEIFNRGVTTVDFAVTPYSVQYAAATSNFSTNKTNITSGIILPGHYFLVQEGSAGAVGAALPPPDATGTINLAATAGKVALVTGTTALTGSGCPPAVTIADFLGYGNTANCFETAPIAVSGTNSNARSVIRAVTCTDTNNNSADFSNPTTAPLARNTATAPAPCP
jgi:uncharacterized protein (TIGR03437 family)